MKHMFTLFLLSATALTAFAQNWTGTSGGMAGSGISKPTFSGGGHSVNNSTGTAHGSSNSGSSGGSRSGNQYTPHSTVDKRYKSELKEFNKISNAGWTEQTLAEWLKFAKSTGWPVAWFNYANTASNLHHYQLALGVFKQLITYCPDDARICSMAKPRAYTAALDLGDQQLQAGDASSAEASYREARNMDSNDPHSWCAMSYSSFKQGKYDDALENARGCTSRTSNSDAYRGYAVKTFYKMWEQTEYAKAQEIINKGYVGWSSDALPHLWGAIKYENAAGEPSSNGRAQLASVLHDRGYDTLAEEQADIALLQDPGNSFAQSVLDRIHPVNLASGKGHYQNRCSRILPDEDGTKTSCR